MKIVYLLAGAGGMYCGSCLHGNTLVAGLRNLGADALLAPLYTPLRTDEENQSIARVAFGGVNVYLQEHSALFRHTPWFLDRLFDRPGLLRWLSRRSSTIRPENLGAMTVSMLQGETGHQKKEVEKLVVWLQEIRPDIVHLNNVILIGPAREIRRELGVPVVCSLTGEDSFLEKLLEPHYSAARELLRRRAAELDGLTAMNRYFADFMADYLDVPRSKIEVIPPGLNLSGYGPKPAYRTDWRSSCVIGFLARVCPEKGLHLLAEAVHLLSQEASLPPIRLRAAGYLDPADRWYLENIHHQFADWGIADQFEYAGELDHAEKIDFLASLDVFSVPTIYRESKGLSILEAFAAGVPAVLPRHGTFPEMLEITGGGLLCEPGKPAALAEALKTLILHPDQAQTAGLQAQQRVRERYNVERMARNMLEWYRKIGDRGWGKVKAAC
ncbi:MAG: glycosyltransferase family 4 protein [Pirellulales bacterium]|nr:glycosyltransferase family 4 protein [Pirellulales bacterium]